MTLQESLAAFDAAKSALEASDVTKATATSTVASDEAKLVASKAALVAASTDNDVKVGVFNTACRAVAEAFLAAQRPVPNGGGN